MYIFPYLLQPEAVQKTADSTKKPPQSEMWSIYTLTQKRALFLFYKHNQKQPIFYKNTPKQTYTTQQHNKTTQTTPKTLTIYLLASLAFS